MLCNLSRYIVLATLVGVAASSIAGSDAVGWLAAGVAVALLWLAERLIPQLQGRSCALPAAPADAADVVERPADPPSPLRLDRSPRADASR